MIAQGKSSFSVVPRTVPRALPLTLLVAPLMVFLFVAVLIGGGAVAVGAEQDTLVIASTTSTQNSGLFDYIIPVFERKTGIKVKIIAVGTGQAIAIAGRGDADLIFVHDRPSEEKFVAEGLGVRRYDVMYNDFLLVGPKDDPAGIKGLKDAAAALGKIAGARSLFVSRGDESGTHQMERRLWAEAGVSPARPWYLEAGSGMAATLRIASEKRGYTLTDRATYLHLRDQLDLAVVVEGDPRLFNQYGVTAVNPKRFPHVNARAAEVFIEWILSAEGQRLIGSYGVKEFGEPLFIPNAASKAK